MIWKYVFSSIQCKVNFFPTGGFPDKRCTTTRSLLDTLASKPESKLAAITRGAGEAGVYAWRVSNAKAWERILRRKEAGFIYPTLLTRCARVVYSRLTKGEEEYPQEMPVEFEAWAIIIYKVTFETPHSSHTERNCGRPTTEVAMTMVKKQRDILEALVANYEDNDL
jgi:hypothetical protein